MKIFFIDFENINDERLKELKVEDSDIVYLFYTLDTSKIRIDVIESLKNKINFMKVPKGNQSLDNHLMTYLGFMLAKKGIKIHI